MEARPILQALQRFPRRKKIEPKMEGLDEKQKKIAAGARRNKDPRPPQQQKGVKANRGAFKQPSRKYQPESWNLKVSHLGTTVGGWRNGSGRKDEQSFGNQLHEQDYPTMGDIVSDWDSKEDARKKDSVEEEENRFGEEKSAIDSGEDKDTGKEEKASEVKKGGVKLVEKNGLDKRQVNVASSEERRKLDMTKTKVPESVRRDFGIFEKRPKKKEDDVEKKNVEERKIEREHAEKKSSDNKKEEGLKFCENKKKESRENVKEEVARKKLEEGDKKSSDPQQQKKESGEIIKKKGTPEAKKKSCEKTPTKKMSISDLLKEAGQKSSAQSLAKKILESDVKKGASSDQRRSPSGIKKSPAEGKKSAEAPRSGLKSKTTQTSGIGRKDRETGKEIGKSGSKEVKKASKEDRNKKESAEKEPKVSEDKVKKEAKLENKGRINKAAFDGKNKAKKGERVKGCKDHSELKRKKDYFLFPSETMEGPIMFSLLRRGQLELSVYATANLYMCTQLIQERSHGDFEGEVPQVSEKTVDSCPWFN
ncbi:hypothetical protein OSTOST_03216, partial [Ostertagia ostertagi]